MKNLNMSRPGSVFLLGGVLLASVTAYTLYNYLQGVKTPAASKKIVVMARADISSRSEIKPEMVVLMQVPPESLIPNTATALDQVVGKVTITAVKQYDQFRLKDLAAKDKVPGLSYTIPSGMRAITISINDTKGVSGAIHPGDHVDILCSLKDASRGGSQSVQVPLQDLNVLAIDRAKTESTDVGATSSLTLCTTPEQAQLLTAAEDEGQLRVILRAREDHVPMDDKGVNLDQLLKRAAKPAEDDKPKAEPGQPAAPPPPVKKIKIFDGANSKEYPVPY
jgi:pilus assembly protein CpaB